MSTIPFLIKFARGQGPQDTPENELGNQQFPHTREAVTPNPPTTIMTHVRHETTDET